MIPLIIIASIIIVIGTLIKEHYQAKALKQAEALYREALDTLGVDGQNNLLRQDALEKGRHFAELARKKAGSNGVAIFDEVALTNDITARLGSNSGSTLTAACPECAEQIQPAARRCRFCGIQFRSPQVAA